MPLRLPIASERPHRAGRFSRSAVLALAALVATPPGRPATAQPPQAAEGDGSHDFDFEIGSWRTHLRRLLHPLSGSKDWVDCDGTTVVRKVWDGRANLVELEVDCPGGHLEALSLRLYDSQSRRWSLNFASSRGGSLSQPTIGQFTNGRGEFVDQETFDGRPVLVRFVISDITANSCHFEQAFSADAGRTWEVNWIATDTRIAPSADRPDGDQASLVSTFQGLEQKLMDAIAPGDKAVWESIMDDSCVITSEEGQLSSKADFLRELKPLPPGLAGRITVRDLTVQSLAPLVIVRYEADEWEQVFGQRLTTKYRMTDAFRRNGAGWKLVSSHTSVVTADPPAQSVDKSHWLDLVGDYQLLPDGWVFHVELRDGVLYGGRSPGNLRPLIPLTPVGFVLEGSLGELLFDTGGGGGRASRIVDFRKFEPLVWTRVAPRTP